MALTAKTVQSIHSIPYFSLPSVCDLRKNKLKGDLDFAVCINVARVGKPIPPRRFYSHCQAHRFENIILVDYHDSSRKQKWGEGGRKEGEWTGKVKVRQGRKSWQQVKHAWLYSDLLLALKELSFRD